MAKTVIGILENPSAAQQAADELLKSGFERRDVGVISTDLMREAATAATGASKGMAFGALAGMLLSAATMMIPGLGPILVAGPGLTLLGGTTLGALAGGIVGALKARGVPEEQANFYAEGVRRGGTLITVNAKTDELAQRAVQILKQHGAVDIDQRVAGKDGRGALLGEDRLRPTPGEEVAVLVGVAAALAADIEVDHLTGLACRLADMAAAARSGLFRGGDDLLDVWVGGAHSSAEGRPRGQVNRYALVDVDACGPDRVVEEQLSEKALRLGRLEPIGHGAVRLLRRRKVFIACGHLQVM